MKKDIDIDFEKLFEDDKQQLKKGTGRPKKNEADKLKNRVSLLFTDAEYEQIKNEAGSVALAVFLKQKALK